MDSVSVVLHSDSVSVIEEEVELSAEIKGVLSGEQGKQLCGNKLFKDGVE